MRCVLSLLLVGACERGPEPEEPVVVIESPPVEPYPVPVSAARSSTGPLDFGDVVVAVGSPPRLTVTATATVRERLEDPTTFLVHALCRRGEDLVFDYGVLRTPGLLAEARAGSTLELEASLFDVAGPMTSMPSACQLQLGRPGRTGDMIVVDTLCYTEGGTRPGPCEPALVPVAPNVDGKRHGIEELGAEFSDDLELDVEHFVRVATREESWARVWVRAACETGERTLVDVAQSVIVTDHGSDMEGPGVLLPAAATLYEDMAETRYFDREPEACDVSVVAEVHGDESEDQLVPLAAACLRGGAIVPGPCDAATSPTSPPVGSDRSVVVLRDSTVTMEHRDYGHQGGPIEPSGSLFVTAMLEAADSIPHGLVVDVAAQCTVAGKRRSDREDFDEIELHWLEPGQTACMTATLFGDLDEELAAEPSRCELTFSIRETAQALERSPNLSFVLDEDGPRRVLERRSVRRAQLERVTKQWLDPDRATASSP